MDSKLNFERKISFEPLLISIFFGIVVSVIIYAIFSKIPIFILAGGFLAFGVDSLVIFPRSLKEFYDYWRVDETGIYYSDYDTWSKQLSAIFLPMHHQLKRIPFIQIKSFAIVDGKDVMNTQNSTGGKLSYPLARKTHCLIVNTDNKEICLRCGWTDNDSPISENDIKGLVSFLNSKL